MPTPEELDRICIVLVRARNPNNIGAAARAMHDFGLRHMRVVNDYPVPFEGARSAVCHSRRGRRRLHAGRRDHSRR
jgi:tRNA/rRNA methyltransferase